MGNLVECFDADLKCEFLFGKCINFAEAKLKPHLIFLGSTKLCGVTMERS